MEDEHKDPVDEGKLSTDSANNHNAAPQYDEESGRRKSRNLKDDPFGDESNAEVKYRTMHWWQAAITMIAETISLGILSLPSVLAAVGIVGGLILLIGLGIIATYTGYVIGQFKLAYPHVHNMADAGEVLFEPIGMGAIGREFFGTAQIIFLIFIMGSHILTWIIALNAMSDHATCSIVWGVIGLIVLFIFTLPRTLKKVSYFSIFCT
jgi:amino acid permease